MYTNVDLAIEELRKLINELQAAEDKRATLLREKRYEAADDEIPTIERRTRACRQFLGNLRVLGGRDATAVADARRLHRGSFMVETGGSRY
jgi:hypothetical protein